MKSTIEIISLLDSTSNQHYIDTYTNGLNEITLCRGMQIYVDKESQTLRIYVWSHRGGINRCSWIITVRTDHDWSDGY